MEKIYEVLKYFPINIYNILLYTLEQNNKISENLQEIRIRANRPILLKLREADILIDYIVTRKRVVTDIRKDM